MRVPPIHSRSRPFAKESRHSPHTATTRLLASPSSPTPRNTADASHSKLLLPSLGRIAMYPPSRQGVAESRMSNETTALFCPSFQTTRMRKSMCVSWRIGCNGSTSRNAAREVMPMRSPECLWFMAPKLRWARRPTLYHSCLPCPTWRRTTQSLPQLLRT